MSCWETSDESLFEIREISRIPDPKPYTTKNRYPQASLETQNKEVRLDQVLMTSRGGGDGWEEVGQEEAGDRSWSTL